MAYTKQPFCTVEFLKANSVIDVNCDEALVRNSIIEAQELYMENILGTALYDKLVTDMGTSSITGIYLTLLDRYILDCVKNYAIYLLIPELVYKMRNRSIDTQSGENSTPVGQDEIDRLQKIFMGKAQKYTKKLNDYMLENYSSIPELAENTNISQKQPSNTSYTVTMYLGEDDQQRLIDKFYA